MDSLPPSTPPGLCECGCGRPAPIAACTDRRHGAIKGQPHRFCNGHHRTIPVSERPGYREQATERFWRKVDMSGGPDACWPWRGRTARGGYGQCDFLGKAWYAHRLAFVLTNGPIPDGQDVCHTCDNPPCCNPHDLFTGTHLDNMIDMMTKGRKARLVGEQAGTAKLTEAQVREIRKSYIPRKVTHAILAARYGVSKHTIGNVLDGTRWGHVA